MVILGAWLLADFISGIVHWYEDRAFVGASRSEFLNGVRADNERHHKMPGYLTRYSWWENINTTAPAAWMGAGAMFVAGCEPIFWLTAAFLGVGNLVHRWAHEAPAKLPVPVRLMQKTGLFQTASHHSGHHFKMSHLVSREDADIRFCVMTNWLNPVLDKTQFFRFLEFCFRLRG